MRRARARFLASGSKSSSIVTVSFVLKIPPYTYVLAQYTASRSTEATAPRVQLPIGLPGGGSGDLGLSGVSGPFLSR